MMQKKPGDDDDGGVLAFARNSMFHRKAACLVVSRSVHGVPALVRDEEFEIIERLV